MCLVSQLRRDTIHVHANKPAESVPYVDRAFVHIDYTDYNFPTHMSQQE